MNSTKTKGALIAIASTLIAISTAAYAEKPPVIVDGVLDMPTVHVSYADLNLRSQAGLQVLQARVRRAASTICLEPQVRELPRVIAARNCYNSAMARAQDDIERVAGKFGTVTVAGGAPTIVVAALP